MREKLKIMKHRAVADKHKELDPAAYTRTHCVFTSELSFIA